MTLDKSHPSIQKQKPKVRFTALQGCGPTAAENGIPHHGLAHATSHLSTLLQGGAKRKNGRSQLFDGPEKASRV
jgi:hypothetical protein